MGTNLDMIHYAVIMILSSRQRQSEEVCKPGKGSLTVKCMHSWVLRLRVSLCIRILNVNGGKNTKEDVLQNPGIKPASLQGIEKAYFLQGNYWIKQEPEASLRPGRSLDGFHAISSLCLDNYILWIIHERKLPPNVFTELSVSSLCCWVFGRDWPLRAHWSTSHGQGTPLLGLP